VRGLLARASGIYNQVYAGNAAHRTVALLSALLTDQTRHPLSDESSREQRSGSLVGGLILHLGELFAHVKSTLYGGVGLSCGALRDSYVALLAHFFSLPALKAQRAVVQVCHTVLKLLLHCIFLLLCCS
jgi:hypothetical protein